MFFLKIVYLIKFISLDIYASGKSYPFFIEKGHVRKPFGNGEKAPVIYLSSRIHAKVLLLLIVYEILWKTSVYCQRMSVFTANALKLSHKFESLVEQSNGLIKYKRCNNNDDSGGNKNRRVDNSGNNCKSRRKSKKSCNFV